LNSEIALLDQRLSAATLRPASASRERATARTARAHIDDHVFRQIEGPQGRAVVEQSNVYTILALLPVEADGRLRYRVKSKEENFERIVTEDSLSRLN
jgi:hypothetical protein